MSGGDEGGGHEGGGHEAPLWERLLGWGNAALHAGGHTAVHALEHAKDAPGLNAAGGVLGKYLPWVGTAVGAGQFGYHAHEAANTADNGDYLNNEHWTHVGEATLGAAGAAASWCPPAALYLGAGELGLDALGAGSGWVGNKINDAFGTHLDLGFNAGSVVGGVEHLASNVSMKEHPIINSLMMACPLTAPIALAANMGDLVTGAGEAIDTVGHGIGSAWDWTKETASDAWGATKRGAGAAWDWTKDTAGDAWNWTKDTAGGAWDSTKRGAGAAWDWTKDTASGAWDSTKRGAGAAWDWTKDTASGAWDSTKRGAGAAWDWTKDTASAGWNATKDTASNAWNTTKQGAGAAWDWTKDTASSAWSGAKNIASDTWSGAKNVASDTWDTVSDW